MGGKLLCILAIVKSESPGLGWPDEEAASLFEALAMSVNVGTTGSVGVWGLGKTAGNEPHQLHSQHTGLYRGVPTGRDRSWLFGY